MGSHTGDTVAGELSKIVGDEGVFSTNSTNGAVLALANANASSWNALPYRGSADEHNARTRAYFVTAGLPAEQIRGVHVTTRMKSTPTNDYEFVSWDTVIQRAVEGIFVHESVAWARFNNNGETIEEQVHWPPLPQSVVDEAIALTATLADSVRGSAFRARLPPNLPEGKVKIHHSSFYESGPVTAQATYDVVRSTNGTSYDMHFGSDGNELRLAGETSGAPPVHQK